MAKLNLPILLIISQNPSVLFWVKKHLSSEFFVIEAKTRQKALEVAKTSDLDLILLDGEVETFLPLKLSAELKNLYRGQIPTLLITGRLKKSFLDQAMASGITDFISSRLNEEELHLRILAAKKVSVAREKTSALSSILSKKKSS